MITLSIMPACGAPAVPGIGKNVLELTPDSAWDASSLDEPSPLEPDLIDTQPVAADEFGPEESQSGAILDTSSAIDCAIPPSVTVASEDVMISQIHLFAATGDFTGSKAGCSKRKR